MPPLSSATETTTSSLGAKLAHSIARRDFAQLAELLHPAVDFRALTPRRVWEPANRDEVLDVIRTWFGDADIQDVLCVDTHELAGRFHVAYQYQGERPGGPFLIEQQAYYAETDGQISWIRLLCSGYRPR
ncbi:MAG: hypothetical protein ACRDNK_02235 [Solirubrobacteraceae bacterium]